MHDPTTRPGIDPGELPAIIQGGMGIGVSGWRLARAVSAAGQLGVVSGTGIDILLARRLQDGDPGGELRRALGQFPLPGVAGRVLERYFLEGGRAPGQPYRGVPMPGHRPCRQRDELVVAANFVEVFLAKEGHGGPVGCNFLQKIQAPTLPSLYGAMLAGVDVVIVGAGVPRAIPGILDRFARGEAATLRLEVEGIGEGVRLEFDPGDFLGGTAPMLTRPHFFPIVSSALLARTLARKATGRVDGFIVEDHSAGGHNAPPRGPARVDDAGEPVYGERDRIDLGAIGALGLPFWLAGSQGRAGALAQARACGAHGIQVGTLFAFCEESGLDPALKQRVVEGRAGDPLPVRTDPLASPTGFPLKVVGLPGTLAEDEHYRGRARVCDLGHLREPFARPGGGLGWRCPAEPVGDWTRKGGEASATEGRKCLCNGLIASVGLGQWRPGGRQETPLLTAGNELGQLDHFEAGYTARDVLDFLVAAPGRS